VGVRFAGDYTIIRNNFVRYFCGLKDDGGGIYTGNFSGTERVGIKIVGNIVLDGLNAIEGTSSTGSATSGIYTDDGSWGIEIRGNTVARVGLAGFYVHNAVEMQLADNTVYDATNAVYMNSDHSTTWPAIRAVDLTGNVFFARTADQKLLSLRTNGDRAALGAFGAMNGNHYVRPLEDGVGIATRWKEGSTVVEGMWDLAGWSLQFGKDTTSKGSPHKVPTHVLSAVVGGNRVQNGAFTTASTSGFGCSGCTVAIEASGKLDGNYLRVTPTAMISSVAMKVGAVTAGKVYRLRYSLRGSNDQHISLGAHLRQPGAPYARPAPEVRRTIGTARSQHEILFVPTVSEPDARLFFNIMNSSTTVYYLDNIELVEITGKVTNPDEVFRFEVNPSPFATTVALPAGSWVDARGTRHTTQVSVPANGALILIKE
jgi:hypothetical protein